MELITWFWTNINFRNWTFEGNKLANPLLIIWRLILIIPIKITFYLLYILLAISGNKYIADNIKEYF